MEPDYEFLHDNAPSHTSKKTKDWLKEKKVAVVPDFPPYSPDFNGIEYIWKILKDEVESDFPASVEELKYSIKKAWSNLKTETIRNCILHVNKNFQKCLDNEGK